VLNSNYSISVVYFLLGLEPFVMIFGFLVSFDSH